MERIQKNMRDQIKLFDLIPVNSEIKSHLMNH